MTISATPSEIAYSGDGSSVAFPIPFPFDTASDLKVISTSALGVPVVIINGFVVAAGGGSTGTLTMNVAPAVGTTLTILDDPARTQVADYVANDAFPEESHERALDRCVRLIKRQYQLLQRTLRMADGDPISGDSLVLGSVQNRKGKYLFFNSITGAIEFAANIVTTTLSQSIIGQLLNPITPQESLAGVTIVNYWRLPGQPERYGAVGNGVTSDQTAIDACIAANNNISFCERAVYAVNSITFPTGRQFNVRFNGASFRGIASSATACVVRIKTNTSTFHDYKVDINFNDNYTCGTWWYDADQASQFNNFFGMNHTYGRKALVYGEQNGFTSTSLAQSENTVYGFRTRGIQNPFFGNHANGVLTLDSAHMIALNEEWPGSPVFNWTDASAFDNYNGTVHWTGGELVKAGSNLGFAANLSNVFMENVHIETACPIRQVGARVSITGGRTLMGRDDSAQFVIGSGVNSELVLSDMFFIRNAGGAYSSAALVDATAAAAGFRTILNNTRSFEWRWSMVAGDARLVQGGVVVYNNHRLNITTADTEFYVLNSNGVDLLEAKGIDPFGYLATGSGGWFSHNTAGATTFSISTDAGPTGYLASQFKVVATGNGFVNTVDTTTLATIKTSAFLVRPGEHFTVESFMRIVAGTNVKLVANFYDLAGALVGTQVTLADSGSIGSSWKFIQAMVLVPATAAYMGLGVFSDTSTGEWTEFRVRRAS